MRRLDWLALVALAVLTLPFHPTWIDFETARRGVLLVVGGLAIAALPCRWPTALPRGSWVLAALCGWLLQSCLDAMNLGEAWLRCGHWFALGAVFVFGSTRDPHRLAWAVVVVTTIVAGYGLLQALGLDWPTDYASPSEPVSTLGNRNVAAEVVAIGAAAAAFLVARDRAWRPAVGALLIAALYLGANASRGGLLAGAVAVAVAATAVLPDRRRARWTGLSLAVVVAALGVIGLRSAEVAPAASTNTMTATAVPSTVEVRLEMWGAATRMIAEQPIAGHGAGQFRYEYPRYRTEREIELSTYGRRFPAAPATVHQDVLELAVEAGVPAAALWLLFLALTLLPALRSAEHRALVAPACALVVLSLVRSPLLNAPAAAAAFALLGAAATRVDGTRSLGWLARIVGLALGLVAIVLGGAVAAAETQGALWLTGGHDDHLDRAIDWHPSEPRYRSLRIQTRCGGLDDTGTLRNRGDLEYTLCRADLVALAQLDPNDTSALFLAASLAHGAGRTEAAQAALGRLLAIDSRDPRAVMLAAVMLAESQAVPRAIATLYADPHPRLRERLADILTGLADSPTVRRDPTGHARLLDEAAFIHALDTSLIDPQAAATQTALATFSSRVGTADHRVRVLLAYRMAATNLDAAAATLAPEHLDLPDSVRRLLATLLTRLDLIPAWSAAL